MHNVAKPKRVSIPTLDCLRCYHSWIPRQVHVRMCPQCKSLLWNVEPPPAAIRRRVLAKKAARARWLKNKGGR